jgi:N-formylglutamate deformylase
MTDPNAPFRLRRGTAPLLVSMPHVGTHLPDAIAAAMTPVAHRLDDTDWHLETLYDFLGDMGASVLVAHASRYVVDLNRDPSGRSLYPGQDTTPLCPLDTFEREPLYRDGAGPDAAETDRRVATWWKPYHAALAEELARIRAEHGVALLWDAHSIRSVVPRFFPGRLTDLNIGTARGASCGAGLGEALLAVAQEAGDAYTAVLDGRFVGGQITRAYGRPAEGVHAVQLELVQATYMEEAPPWRFDPTRAAGIRPVLRAMVGTALERVRALA